MDYRQKEDTTAIMALVSTRGGNREPRFNTLNSFACLTIQLIHYIFVAHA